MTTSDLENRFYRFPLVSLAYPADPLETILNIMAWCLLDIGTRASDGMPESGKVWSLYEFEREKDPEMFERVPPKTLDEALLFRGAMIANVDLHSPCSEYVKRQVKLDRFIRAHPGPASKNTVTIKSNLKWSCIYTLREMPQERTLSWQEFQILCALLSKIGNGKFAKCGWKEIQARAAGWCGKTDLTKAPATEREAREHLILTRDQIRTTLIRLETDNFFARFIYNRAESWFSFSCKGDRKILQQWVAALKVRRSQSIRTKREEDSACSASIFALKNPGPLPTASPDPDILVNFHNDGKKLPSRKKAQTTPPPCPHPAPTSTPPHPPPLTKSNRNGSNENNGAKSMGTIMKDSLPLCGREEGEKGHLIDGIFYDRDAANHLMASDPTIFKRAQRAIRNGSKITVDKA